MAVETIADYIISGNGAPTTSTVGTVGKFYKDKDNTNGVMFWICTGVSGSTYTWEKSAANIRMTNI